MLRTVWAGLGLALIVSVSQPVFAQSLRGASGPANLPPASYAGKQWIDSKGCVFIRAGVGGSVNWVPRVSRDRKHLCGQRPTSATTVATRRVAPAAVAAAPKPRIVAAAPAPRQQRIVRQAPVTQVYRPAPTVTYTAPARRVTQQARSYAQPTHVRPQITRSYSGNCANFRSNTAAAYTNSGSQVRCGGQTVGIAQAPTTIRGAGASFASGAVQLANPRSAYVAPEVTRGTYTVKTVGAGVKQRAWTAKPNDGIRHTINTVDPAGYSQDWTDGRLNPYRGTPSLRSSNGYTAPRPEYSTRSYAQPTQRAVSGGRYVQIGSFGVAGNANRAAARFQNMGLPVRITNSRGLKVVMIGPMAGGSLNSALSSARRAGFGDAFIRR